MTQQVQSRSIGSACIGMAILLCGVPAVSAQVATPSESRQDALADGTIVGHVQDVETGAPLIGVAVRIAALGRGDLSRTDGSFSLRNVPPGQYILSLQRIGYAGAEERVEVTAGATTTVTVGIRPSALELTGIVVTSGGRAQRPDEVFQPTSALSGSELRRRIATSVATTVASEPGITERYNGPAASQPVIRGLSGDRVLVLEDGNRTGDVASTAGDHAISVDPVGAQRIEVVRGPAGLLYGSNALGGVINVIREDVPRTRPERLTGSASLQAESVNRGMAAATEVRGAVGDVAWRAAVSGRFADDTRTPLGDLPSTDLTGHSAGVGLTWIRPTGFAGAAIRDFSLNYGVPGTFQGQTIPGAHEGGVDIEMRRIAGTGTAGWLGGWGPFSSVELDATYAWYHHREIESSGFVGTEFGQLSGTGRLVARHHHDNGSLRREGAVGLWAMGRDFNVAGSNTGTRPAREYVAAAFAYEELAWDRFRLQLGGRYDHARVEPLDLRPGQIGSVRTRDFGALSASVSAIVDLGSDVSVGATAARAFRTPSIEELFSDGPHLADYSYNIGNPDLDPEFGFGTDLFARLSRQRVQAEIGIFRNRIDDFVHYTPTGELDPRLNRYPVYRAAQADAVLHGGEAMLEWEALPSLVVRSQVSYVRGTRLDSDEPLPAMPPLQGSQSVRYDSQRWFGLAEWRAAAGQDRVAENEVVTDGYSLLEIGGGLRWVGMGGFHSLTVMVGNVTDSVWRDHLSRIRAVAPQPGRNVRLIYHIEL